MPSASFDQPLEVLLFSDVAVVIAYVHQLTIFMIVPIFNAMARIDKKVIEAAVDAGASRLDIMRYIVRADVEERHCAWDSIFVVSIVMGDFFVVEGDVGRRLRIGRRRVL